MLLVCSPLPRILIICPTQYYSGTHIRCETELQRGMDYGCVYQSQLFFPVFLLLTEAYFCIPGDINCNKEDMMIMSSVTQDDDDQISNVLLSIRECDKVNSRGEKGNKERWYCGLCGNDNNIWNFTKELIHLTISSGHRND